MTENQSWQGASTLSGQGAGQSDSFGGGAYGSGGGSYSPWWQETPATPPPAPAPSGKRPLGLIAATAVLAALLGGGAGAATGALVADDSSSNTSVSQAADPTNGSSASVTLPTGTTAAVAAKVLPSVVQITEQTSQGVGTGSGVVLDTDGYILTNNHVVAGVSSGQLKVTFNDGTTASAKVVGADQGADIAVIKVDGVANLKPITIGSSSSLVVGQQVVAVGSPLGLAGTVTEGIVSALNRPVTTSDASGSSASADTVLNAIQTDTAINPGNSGGALVDMNGKLVGVNSAIASLSSGSGESGSIGLGFAIPVDQAKRIADQLIKTGSSTRALLGARLTDSTSGTSGAVLQSVDSGSAAAKAGLQSGDVVTKFGKQLIDSSEALVAAVRSAVPGSSVTVTYQRNGSTRTVDITLGSTPS